MNQKQVPGCQYASPHFQITVVLVVKLVGHHSCGADRLPVAVRFPAGPRVGLKTADPPKGNGLGQKKISTLSDNTTAEAASNRLFSIQMPLALSFGKIHPLGVQFQH